MYRYDYTKSLADQEMLPLTKKLLVEIYTRYLDESKNKILKNQNINIYEELFSKKIEEQNQEQIKKTLVVIIDEKGKWYKEIKKKYKTFLKEKTKKWYKVIKTLNI